MADLLCYYIGLDLGQAADYTALSVIEEPIWVGPRAKSQVSPHETGWVSPASMTGRDAEWALEESREEGRPPHPPLSVRHLERFDLGTRYPAIIERVHEMVRTPPLADKPATLLVDKTGVGASVVDSFEHSGVHPVAITIHGGSEVTPDPQRAGWRVPKRDLVSTVQVLLQNKRLKIAGGLPEAATLRQELLNFRVKIDPKTAHDSYSHWREGDHDDLVLATAMACWFREWWNAHLETRFAKEARMHS